VNFVLQISEENENSVRLSGNRKKSYEYVSNHNAVTVRFISDANTKSTGFLMSYRRKNKESWI